MYYRKWNLLSHARLFATTRTTQSTDFSRGSSQPRDRTQVSSIAGKFFTSWATRKARQNLVSMGCSRQEYWSELPEDLLDPRTEPASPALAGGFFTTGASWEANLSRPGINFFFKLYENERVRVGQFSSVAQSCLTVCDPMDCSTPGLPVHHQLLEPAQTGVHQVSDAIQPSPPLSSPSLPALNLSQHQGVGMNVQWVTSSHQGAKVWVLQLQFGQLPTTK